MVSSSKIMQLFIPGFALIIRARVAHNGQGKPVSPLSMTYLCDQPGPGVSIVGHHSLFAPESQASQNPGTMIIGGGCLFDP